MFRFCNCDGIKASRKLSKSCRVNAGGGLGCDGVAAAFAGGGVGSEINGEGDGAGPCANTADRKSTRLNSSHVSISYAVCCLKKNESCRLTFGNHTDLHIPAWHSVDVALLDSMADKDLSARLWRTVTEIHNVGKVLGIRAWDE